MVKTIFIAILLTFQIVSVLCDCERPNPISRPKKVIKDQCGNGECNQYADGEICHCQVSWQDTEPPGHTASKSKVKMYGKRNLCWEEKDSDDDRFYEDCNEMADSDCLHTDKIEICYRDDIDAAQAMCRQFTKGDAYDSKASRSGRKLKRRDKNGRRILLAYLKCPILPSGVKSCQLEYLPEHITECYQMVAHCWFSGCWQDKHSVRARSVYGAVSGKIRYGQMCKIDTSEAHGQCTKECFRCPQNWQGNRFDGVNCFAANGGNAQEGSLIWEPHFRTLDGKHFDFQGQCSYYLMKHGSFNIVAKFSVCGKRNVTCASEITVTSGRTVLRLGQGQDFSVTYRGRPMRRATKPFHNDDINYYLASSEFDAVDVWNGFKILWDGRAEYKVVVPSWNNVVMEGMLGNLNGNPDDDMITPRGALETDPVKFGDSWMVPGSCPPGVSSHAPPNPVLTDAEKSEAHEKGCKYFNLDGGNPASWPNPFKNCSSVKALVERQAEYDNCLMDVATCNRDLSACLCPSFSFFADYCQKNGEGVGDWRSKMPGTLCKLECDAAKKEVFRMDADPCSQTCDAIKYIKENAFDCVKMQVEGCNCKEGMARNKDGVCVNIKDCPE